MTVLSKCVLAGVALSGFMSAADAATSVAGSMNLRVNSSIAGGALSATDHSSDSFIGSPVTMGVFALASINDGVTGGNVIARGQGQASGNANAGTVHFQDYGWTFNAPDRADAGQGANTSDHSQGSDWSYTFIADHDGLFSISYNTFVSMDGGLTFGLQGWDIDWSGAGGGLSLTDVTDPTASGVFSRSLISGEMYTVSLVNNANISSVGQPIGSGYMGGTFNYAIKDAVPEPASWALMLGGFGLVGGVMRGQRKSTRALA
jgi:hypothetical protein